MSEDLIVQLPFALIGGARVTKKGYDNPVPRDDIRDWCDDNTPGWSMNHIGDKSAIVFACISDRVAFNLRWDEVIANPPRAFSFNLDISSLTDPDVVI